jgi:hypothetical protein
MLEVLWAEAPAAEKLVDMEGKFVEEVQTVLDMLVVEMLEDLVENHNLVGRRIDRRLDHQAPAWP